MKDLLITVYGGGDEAVAAAVALAGLEKHWQAQVAIDDATGEITDIVTVLRGVGFASLSPSADESASTLHYCVNQAADEIERLREERRWIPVGERMPKEGERVLFFVHRRNTDYAAVYAGEYIKCFDSWAYDSEKGWASAFVTHWMPLPEKPCGRSSAAERLSPKQ